MKEFQEKSELSIYLRFIECQSFDKKLKGINGIRDYISRASPGNSDEKRASSVQTKPLSYFNPEKLADWLLNKHVIELIYLRYSHIELIKRSIDIISFLGDTLEDIPTDILDIVWNSHKDKHEDLVLSVYSVIAEIGYSLGLRGS